MCYCAVVQLGLFIFIKLPSQQMYHGLLAKLPIDIIVKYCYLEAKVLVEYVMKQMLFHLLYISNCFGLSGL